MPGVESTDTPIVPPTSVSRRPSTVKSCSLVMPGSRGIGWDRTCMRSGGAASIGGMTRLLVAAGALVGLVTLSGPGHGHGRSAWHAAAPYATHAAVGAALGLAVALALGRAARGRLQ